LVDDRAVGGDLKGRREADLSGMHVLNALLVGSRSGATKRTASAAWQ
jgi:hypothetical protein